MEKMTRVKKYKELRDNMKEEVSIDRKEIKEVVEEDDFLSFIPKKEEPVNMNDTLMNPLSYETLDETAQHVKDALNLAKMNVGKDQYDTRLDILSRIKNEDKYDEEELNDIDLSKGHVVNQKPKKMTLLEKLASMSPEEDVLELQKFEEEEKEKIEEKEETEEIKLFTELMEEDKEKDDENEKKLLTVLNCIIILLIIVFICFIGIFAYQLFF